MIQHRPDFSIFATNFIFKIRYAPVVLQKPLEALTIRRIHEQRWNVGVQQLVAVFKS